MSSSIDVALSLSICNMGERATLDREAPQSEQGFHTNSQQIEEPTSLANSHVFVCRYDLDTRSPICDALGVGYLGGSKCSAHKIYKEGLWLSALLGGSTVMGVRSYSKYWITIHATSDGLTVQRVLDVWDAHFAEKPNTRFVQYFYGDSSRRIQIALGRTPHKDKIIVVGINPYLPIVHSHVCTYRTPSHMVSRGEGETVLSLAEDAYEPFSQSLYDPTFSQALFSAFCSQLPDRSCGSQTLDSSHCLLGDGIEWEQIQDAKSILRDLYLADFALIGVRPWNYILLAVAVQCKVPSPKHSPSNQGMSTTNTTSHVNGTSSQFHCNVSTSLIQPVLFAGLWFICTVNHAFFVYGKAAKQRSVILGIAASCLVLDVLDLSWNAGALMGDYVSQSRLIRCLVCVNVSTHLACISARFCIPTLCDYMNRLGECLSPNLVIEEKLFQNYRCRVIKKTFLRKAKQSKAAINSAGVAIIGLLNVGLNMWAASDMEFFIPATIVAVAPTVWFLILVILAILSARQI